MPDLVFRKPNNITGSLAVELRYRLAGSGQPYSTVTLQEGDFPHTVQNVQDGQYELGARVKCANGAYSSWESGTSDGCAPASGFSVYRSGSNFVILYDLGASQTKFQIEVTDPNGGQTIKDFSGTNAGTVNIAIAQNIQGGWGFRLRGVCNDAVTPVYASAWTAPVYVELIDGCNPPVIGVVTDDLVETNTVTKTFNYSGYTSLVRIRVTDIVANQQYINRMEDGSGSVQIIFLKGKLYNVQIFNQCAPGQEAAAEYEVNLLV